LSLTLEASAVDDGDLLARCIAGDARAQRAFIEKHQRFVFRTALKVVGDRHTAEDMAQETFLKLLDKLGSFRGDTPIETWLYRVTVNHCLDHLRRFPAKRRPAPLDAVAESPFEGEDPEDSALSGERQRAVAAALAELPEKYRIVYLLHHFEDQSYEEIARGERTSVSAIKMRMARGRQMLVAKLTSWAEKRR
jgi:RNA polymerase sigma-70 factor (ECF subfamily)